MRFYFLEMEKKVEKNFKRFMWEISHSIMESETTQQDNTRRTKKLQM